MAEKRKRVVLGFNQKLEIIKRLKQDETATSIAQIYGVGRTTVNDIKRDAEKIEQHVSKMQSTHGDVKSRKTMKPAKFDQLDNAMYQWFIQARSQGIPLSGPIIMTKAVEMNKKLEGDPNFKASIGWLDKFKFRHGIRQLVQLDVSGEKLSAVVADFKEQLNFKISQLNLIREQVYNCDETGLNWKALPQKTLASLLEKTAPGFKVQKDRITAMVCANATGNHRLPLLVIGKSKKPRAFKNFNMNALPVNYYAQKSASMEETIFSEWFHNVFVPQVRAHMVEKQLPQEALLLMDNVPTHPSCELQSDDGKITCVFLPANTTRLIQPMDQGIIENMKRRYRKAFIESLLSSDDSMTVKEFWKRYNIKDAIFNVATAWADLTGSNLKNGWNKLLPEPNDETEGTETVCVDEIVQLCNNVGLNSENITPEEVTDWLECDKMDGGFEILNDDEIVSSVTTIEEEEIDDDEGSVLNQKPTTSHSEAETMLSKCIDWFEMQEEANATQILLLRKIRNIAAQKARVSKTQKEMTDYFKAGRNMESQNLIPSENIKQELGYQGQTVKKEVSGEEESDMPSVIKRRKTSSTSLSCPDEDSVLYCEICQLKYEGGCTTHGPVVYIDNAEAGQDECCSQDSSPLVKAADNEGSQVSVRDKLEQSETGSDEMGTLPNTNCSTESDQMFSVCEINIELGVAGNSCGLQGNVEFKTHQKIHNTEKPFTCAVCGVGFNYYSHLNRHMRTHTGEKSYKCDVCGVEFTGGNLKGHTITHTGEKSYKCDVCSVGFTDVNLKRYKRTRAGERPYKCDVCGVGFADIKVHMRTHTGEKPYKCYVCGVGFTVSGNLKSHLRTHTGEKPYKCDVCGVGFTQSGHLKAHMSTHTGENPYKCDVCGVGFTQSGNLNTHMTTHTGEKPYKCDVCGVGFTVSGNLKSHLKTHTGEKPYKCDVCGVGFTQSGNLKAHMRTHTGEKPYKCDVCGVGFTQSGHLKAHMSTHTGDNPYKYDVCVV